MRAAVTSIDGTDSASSTTPVTPSPCAAVRIRLRTQSAFAKNRPLSKRRIVTPSGDTFSGWRAMSPYWSGVPGTLPMCAT